MNANYHDKGGKQDHGTLIFDKNAGNFDIEFFLSDVPPGLIFRPAFALAFGIAPSSTCPAAGATVAGFDGRVSKDQSTLSLTNKIGGIGGSFQFAPYFDGPYRDASRPPFPWDPKILNGGTGTFTDAVKIGIALAAVAIGAALFVALR